MASISDEDREELTAYLDGEADAETRTRMEARLNREPALRAEADALKKAWELLDHLPRTEPSTKFTSQTLDRLSAIRTSSTATLTVPIPARRVPWVLLATAVLSLMLGWGITNVLLKSRNQTLNLDDPLLVKELRLVDNLPYYLAVENLEFLQALDQCEQFNPDTQGP